MSMNLFLKVKLFGKSTVIRLKQTPTSVTLDCVGDNPSNEVCTNRYLNWCKTLVSEYNLDETEVEDHIRNISLYGTHLLASWQAS